MTASVLVTGASGFLGGHVLDALASALPGVRPVLLARVPAALPAALRLNHVVVEGSLDEAERAADHPALRDCAGIIHLAALVKHTRRDADAVFRANVGGTVEVIRAAARLGCRVVFVSSSGTVGCSLDPAAAPDEEAPFAERTVASWPYYASKVAAERAARSLAGVLDVDLVTLRPPVLLGPGDLRGRSTAHVRRVLRPRPVLVDGGMHFADVRDVAAAAVRALVHPHPRATYHLPGWNGTLLGFAGLVSRVAGRRTRPTVIPWRVARFGAAALAPFGHFVDPVLVEMARHHWNIRSRWSAAELDYLSRDPEVTLRDTLVS